MTDTPPFDLHAAHRWFAADCFNATWTLIESPDRSAADDEAMVSVAHASLHHWRHRDDVSPTNLSVGYWQLARVYALLGRYDEARRYGGLCLEAGDASGPFFVGYGHEALARTAHLAGDAEECREHLARARRLAERIDDVDDRALLENDLAELESELA